MSADDRRDPSDRPPPAARGVEPIRRRTPTIPYGVDIPPGAESGSGLKRPPALRGLRAKTMPPSELPIVSPGSPKSVPPMNSERYEKLKPSVEFTAVRDELDAPYELEEALAPHLAWLTDEDARAELFKQLQKGDHARVLSMMVEARRRYPRNVSIGRSIQIVERAAIARLLARIGPLELVPEVVGKPVLGRDPAALFSHIDGKATFEDVLRASPYPRLRSLEILAELVRRSAVRIRDDQLPPDVAHLPGASGRAPPARRASSMRPAIEATGPFGDDDATGRATLPDPMEVAARAAMLRDQVALERTPKAPGVAHRLETPRYPMPSAADRRHSGAGFRAVGGAAAKEIAVAKVPQSALDERAEPEHHDDRPVLAKREETRPRAELEGPRKIVRKAMVRAPAVVAAELLADAERRDQAAETKRAEPPKPAPLRSSDPDADESDEADLSEAERALRAVRRERERQAALVRQRDAEEPPPESVPARTTLESVAPKEPAGAPSKADVAEDATAAREVVVSPVTDPSPSPVPAPPRPSLEITTAEEPIRGRADADGGRKLPGGVIGLAAVAVLLSFVAVIIALTRHDAPPSPAAQPTPTPVPTTQPVQPPAPTQPAVVAPDTMHVVIDASPREARVFLDDVLLTGHPIDQIIQRDGKKHVIRVEAIGYKTSKTTFEASADTKLIIALELVPMRVAPPPTAAPAAPPPRGTEDIYK